MPLKLVSGPAQEPVTIDFVKTQLRVDNTTEDSLIEHYITAARKEAEMKTDRQLITANYQLITPTFGIDSCRKVHLPKAPLKAVNSVTYYDEDNAEQTWAASNYYVELNEEDQEPGWIHFKEDLPSLYDRKDAVIIDFDAGYGTDNDVPEPIKQWIMMRVGHMYEYRQGAEQAMVKDDLLYPYKLFQVV